MDGGQMALGQGSRIDFGTGRNYAITKGEVVCNIALEQSRVREHTVEALGLFMLVTFGVFALFAIYRSPNS